MQRLLVALMACLAIAGVAVHAAPALATVKLMGDSVTGSLFFVQATADDDVTVRVVLNGHNSSSSYRLFVTQFGDATTYGDCYNGATASVLTVTPADTTTHIEEVAVNTITLFGASSIVGRGAGFWTGANDCDTVSAEMPATIGAIGLAYPGPGTTAADNAAKAHLATAPTSAHASLIGGAGNEGISGDVYFQRLDDGEIYVYISATGLAATPAPRKLAFHVHEFGDLSMANGTSAGGHWNPSAGIHGIAPSLTRHNGDIGNITVSAAGNIEHLGKYNLLTFFGNSSFVGRGVVLHALLDDGNPTQSPTSVGNAGGRIARGVIGISSRSPPKPWPVASSSSTAPSSTGVESSSSSTGISGAPTTRSVASAGLVVALACLVKLFA